MVMPIRRYFFVLLSLTFWTSLALIILTQLCNFNYELKQQQPQVKAQNVTEYIKSKLQQITDLEKKWKEKKMCQDYLKDRNKIIKMLPRLTKQTPQQQPLVDIKTKVEVKAQNVIEYIKSKLQQITDLKKKWKEEKMFQDYLKDRNKIIKMLPRLTQQTPTTTFHVLVDKTEKVAERYGLIVLVSSSAVNFERRQNIRRLWGNKAISLYKNWRVVFITGGVENENDMKKLYNEALKEKDVIIGDFMESWSLNMGKKVMTGLQWVDANFNYDYVLKCDDDVFTDIDAILAKLTRLNRTDLYMGNVNSSPVMRTGKYAVPVEEFSGMVFERFCSGGGYVLSASLIKKFIPLIDWEHPLRIDDAYVGILVKKVGSKPLHMNGFLMWNRKCTYDKNLFVSHPAHKDCMEKLQQVVVERKRKYLIS